MNHTPGKVAIISKRLGNRCADVEAVLGLRATLRRNGVSGLQAVVTTSGDPLEAAARAFADARKVAIATYSISPIRLLELDRIRRPLGYRVDGMIPSPIDRTGDDASLATLARLVADAPPGEMILASNFDPAAADLVWLDPYDRSRITLQRAVAIASDLLRHRSRTARRSFAVGVTRWKRPVLRAFLDGPNGAPVFARGATEAAEGAKARSGRVVAWASRPTAAVERATRAAGAPFGRLEDGFLRSVGLGAAFVAPLSLVLDESGIYYDPSGPSDLESLLNGLQFEPDILARAAALRTRLAASELTKYNEPGAGRLVVPEGRFGVLVPGQVEDDASILKGAGAVRTNRDLLSATRARRPEAFIVYKPHPDVVAGYRPGAVAAHDLARLADAVVVGGSVVSLYRQCAAVETMTSLAGFEAMLRGLSVTTHGQPFYAGWGLTEDLAPNPRRTRVRTLDELVAAALILYPLYVDPVTRLPCGPETALDRLEAGRIKADGVSGRIAARLRHVYALARHRLLGPIARRLP